MLRQNDRGLGVVFFADENTKQLYNENLSQEIEFIFSAEATDPKVVSNLLDTLEPSLAFFHLETQNLSNWKEAINQIRMNQKLNHTSVLVIGPKLSAQERTEWLELGVDEWIETPLYFPELKAKILTRIRLMLLNRPAEKAEAKVECGNLMLDLKNREVKVSGADINLTLLEFNLLNYLLQNKGTLKSRDEIVENIWKDNSISNRVLDPHILAIRRKLKSFDHTIGTVYGEGYILKPKPNKP